MAKKIGGLDTFFSDSPTENESESVSTGTKLVRPATKTNDTTKDEGVRATFIVQPKRLDQLKAIAYWDRAKIKDVHDAALEMYIESRKDDIPQILTKRKNKS